MSSEDATKNLETKPSIETLLEKIDAWGERLETRLNRIESKVETTRGELLDLRADFVKLSAIIKEHLPALR